jgi:stalled ribosome rescue protein Dom34
MPSHYHAIVWIDHREAKIFHFKATEVNYMILHPHNPTRHIHHKANAIGNGDAPLDLEFFEQVTEGIADAKAILITGPASAKSELAAHVARRHPDIARCVVGVETIDHPCDGALVAVARLYFKAEDRARPQI